MNRTAFAFAAAFTALTGCAQDEAGTDGRADMPSSFAGIERSQPVGIAMEPITAGVIDSSRSVWEASDLPAGAYWMTIDEVYSTKGGVQMEAGDKQVAMVIDQDGVPMLQGMAAIMELDGALVAAQVDVTTEAPEDGACQRVTRLVSKGTRTAEDGFEMTIEFEDSVIGEDCAKLGLGEESIESITFQATFNYIEQRSEDKVVDGADKG
jgi:hypothetical protein